jgi:hypothetical protein
MESQSRERALRLRPKAASILALTLLIAQCLAVAHYHPRQATSFRSGVTASLDAGLCGLCLFHHYSPLAEVVISLPFALAVLDHIDLYAVESWPLYAFNSYLSGRSPPSGG